MNRAFFVRSSMATAAALTFLRTTPLSSLAADYNTIMFRLIETILPIGALGFPDISAQQTVERIDHLFGLDTSQTFLTSLSAFADVSSFIAGSEELFSAEMATMGSIDQPDLLGQETAAFQASGLPDLSTFDGLSADQRQVYLALWEHSAFNSRRRFYISVRAITFAAFYSMPESWAAIGYAGPLLQSVKPK